MYIIPTRAPVGAITKIIETLKIMSPFSDFSVVGCCQYFLRKRLSDFESYSQGAARKVQGFGSGDTLAQNLIHMYQACKNYYFHVIRTSIFLDLKSTLPGVFAH